MSKFSAFFSKISIFILSWLLPVIVRAETGSAQITDPLGPNASLCGLLKTILNAVFIIGLPIAVLFIAFAGFKFVTARGNAGELETARRNFLYVIIGVAVFFGAWVIAGVLTNTVNPFILLSGGTPVSSACGQ